MQLRAGLPGTDMPLPEGTRYRVKHKSKGNVRLAFKKGTNKVIEAKKMAKTKPAQASE